MTKTILFIVFLAAAVNARAAQVDCHDINKVVKEGVAYSLLGAYEAFTTHACFKGEHFHYFHPERGYATGEVTDPSKLIWFDPKRDSYTIETVKRNGSKYEVAVKFTIDHKVLNNVYTYDPQPDYAKKTGECGFFVSDEGVFRKDCLIQGRLPVRETAGR